MLHKPFKSKQEAFAAGGTLEYANFVPWRGPNGGRVVIDALTLVVTGTVTTGTALWDGRDQARIARLITVEQLDGLQRVNLSGNRTRIFSKLVGGAKKYKESLNTGVGAAEAIDIRIRIPFERPFSYDPNDFTLPADRFGKLTVNWNSLLDMATGTCVITVPALVAYVTAEWHEEMSVILKSEDIVKQQEFASTTQGNLTPRGALHDLYLVREVAAAGTVGGDVVTALTDARIDALGMAILTYQDLKTDYRTKRQMGNHGTAQAEVFINDPVMAGVAFPLIVADEDTSVTDGKVVNQIKIDVGTGVAGLSMISREVVPKSEAGYAATLATFDLHGVAPRVKTRDKTKRDPRAWGKRELALMPWSYPLNKAS